MSQRISGDVLTSLDRKGWVVECYHNKFNPSAPQCRATIVRPSPMRLGNLTDEWTWCGEHLRAAQPDGVRAAGLARTLIESERSRAWSSTLASMK